MKTDSKFISGNIINKYINLGYDSLKTEELAFTIINPNFAEEFNKKTGEIWNNHFQIKAINKLKQDNIDFNFLTSCSVEEKYKPFFLACITGNIDVLKEYLKNEKITKLITLYNEKGSSPLHLAVKNHQLAVVEFLIEKGFNSDIRDRLFRTPLHLSSLIGSAVVTEFLIRNNLEGL